MVKLKQGMTNIDNESLRLIWGDSWERDVCPYLLVSMLKKFRMASCAKHLGEYLPGVDRVFEFNHGVYLDPVFLDFGFNKSLSLQSASTHKGLYFKRNFII
jgi:hypothetical protein